MTQSCLRFVLIFFFLSFGSHGFSQIQQDTLSAHRHDKMGDSLLASHQYREAIRYFQKSLRIYEKYGLWEKYVVSNNGISLSYSSDYNFQQAKSTAEHSLEVCRFKLKSNLLVQAETFRVLAIAYYIHGDYKVCKDFLYKSLGIKTKELGENTEEVSDLYLRIGLSDYYSGLLSQAMESYQVGLTIRKKLYPERHPKLADIYSKMAVVYVIQGYLDKALEYNEKALNIFKENGREKTLSVIWLYMNIADILNRSGHYARSLAYNEKALSLIIEVLGAEHIEAAYLYGNMGTVYSSLRDYTSAIEYYNKSLDLFKKKVDSNYGGLQYVYTNLGFSYYKLGQADTGLKYFQEALAIDDKTFDFLDASTKIAMAWQSKSNYEEAVKYLEKAQKKVEEDSTKCSLGKIIVYNTLGANAMYQERYDEAIIFFKEAMASNVLSYEGTESDQLPEPHDYLSDIELVRSLNDMAKCFRGQFKNSRTVKSLSLAMDCHILIDTLIDNIRESYKTNFDRIEFAKSANNNYELSLSTCMDGFNQNGDQWYLEKAHYFLEKSKGGVLKQIFSDLNAKGFAGLPDDILQFEKELKIDGSYYRSLLIREKSKSQEDSLKRRAYEMELFSIGRSRDSLMEVLENSYPKYHELKYNHETIGVEGVQQKLDDSTTFVSYFLTDSTSFVFTINKEDAVLKELSGLKNLKDDIQKFKKTLVDGELTKYSQHASALYQMLIQPLEQNIVGDHLIISPHGELWGLNFDLLLMDSMEVDDEKQFPYMLTEYSINYANSATLLFKGEELNQNKELLKECLAFSFNDSSSLNEGNYLSMNKVRGAGEDLPGSRQEITSISKMIDGVYYYGNQANEGNFKAHANEYTILHLALHGELDEEKPENSRLYFTQNEDSVEDNYLYSHELFAMELPAELAVLSACNTGTGKLAKGEGVMSLGRAFQYAGTQSLMLSHWEVSDAISPVIMRYFYEEIKAGKSKSKALQAAKLKFLYKDSDNLTSAPYHWGSFYILGDDSPVDLESNVNEWYYSILALFIILLLTYSQRGRFIKTSNS